MIAKTYHFIISVLLLLAPLTTCKGIGCWGADHCKDFIGFNQDYNVLTKLVDQIPNSATFENGRDIACMGGEVSGSIHGGLCVWVWDTDNTTTAAVVKDRVHRIFDHGCKKCGAAPIVDDGSNDLSKGQVTVGWAWNDNRCNGVCDATGHTDFSYAIRPDAGYPKASLGVEKGDRYYFAKWSGAGSGFARPLVFFHDFNDVLSVIFEPHEHECAVAQPEDLVTMNLAANTLLALLMKLAGKFNTLDKRSGGRV
ncbi:hypothetical protein ACLMJK_003255 [Lecanora helva]